MRLNRKKSAFSLIELSIVLIIIGLLIAGVTGGASLIKSSELRSVVTEARGWAVAVNSFYNQFDAYPGDFATDVGAGTGGDGDGLIEYYNGSISESASAWLQMKAAGVLETGIIGATTLIAYTTNPTFTGSTNDAPSSKIKSSGWVFDEDGTNNYVVLTGAVTGASGGGATDTFIAGTLIGTGSITPTDALSIDSKYDDGVGNTGSIRGYVSGCLSSGDYVTTTATKTCALGYRVDVNS